MTQIYYIRVSYKELWQQIISDVQYIGYEYISW